MDEFREKLAAAPSNYELGRVNVQEQTDYINENFHVNGTVTLASGLQYRVLKPGTGRRPTLSDRVKVKYLGRYIDGTVFDESDSDGEPRQFALDEVIKGWQQALTMMEEGAVWDIAVPPGLGYGIQGKGSIPGSVVLLFQLELVEIVEGDPEGADPAADRAS